VRGRLGGEGEVRICPLANVVNRLTSMHTHLVDTCYHFVFVRWNENYSFMLPFHVLPISFLFTFMVGQKFE
jgi:hypothetical protein